MHILDIGTISNTLWFIDNISEGTKIIYDGFEASTRKSQASFQIIRVSSEAESKISLLRRRHH